MRRPTARSRRWLRKMNLPTDAVVGLQMANTIDSVLVFMGVLRAELIAMPLPLLWRRSDATAAIRRCGARALIVSGRAPGTLVVSGAPAGLVSFGGYRFAVRELADVVSGLDPTGTLAVRPDMLAGQRLADAAANPEAIRMALRGIGANPLLVEAFGARPRRGPERPKA
jgi:acyl-CoA synthetase (AMP-forming)/AMP-acid ligase II